MLFQISKAVVFLDIENFLIISCTLTTARFEVTKMVIVKTTIL